MAKKSRRKSQVKRPSRALAEKTGDIAPAAHKPWQIAAVCVVLAVVTVFVYWGVRNNGFVAFDDYDYIVQNPHVQQGITAQSIEWAFTTFHSANWHPLTWISHMADWDLYGNNPAGHHMTSVYWHAADAILLFLLLLYMTGFLWRSAMVAFLFALHPTHVESVAWIAERKDVLCTFFFFAALLAYAWYVRGPSWKRYLWIVCGFACALLSKPMAVTLPFVLLLLDFWPLRRIAFPPETRGRWLSSLGKLCVEKWPLFLMTALSCVITFLAQRAGRAVETLENYPLWGRTCNAAISYSRYVWIMVWPNPLRAFYYYDPHKANVLAAALSAIALFLVTAVCWRIRQKRPYCLVGWLWFLGTLIPVMGIVQVGGQAMAERYTYIPSIGLFIAAVWLAGDAVAKFPKIGIVTQLLAVAILVTYAVKSEAQIKVWKDSITLFSHVLKVDPRGEFPNFFMGQMYMNQGKYTEAQSYLDRALVYKPNDTILLSYSARDMMEIMLRTHDLSNLSLAGQRLQTALNVSPNDPSFLSNMALWSALMGRPKDVEAYSRKALALLPGSVDTKPLLAIALHVQGELDQTIQKYRHALVLDPYDYDAHNNLGMIFARQGLTEEALKEFQLSLAIKPDQPMAYFEMGSVLVQAHRLPEAIEEFTQAVRLDPANASAHNSLGSALFQFGDYEKAAEQFTDALRIDPTFAYARINLETVQARMKIK